MVRDLAGDTAFADDVAKGVRQRGVIDYLMAQRVVANLSQKDVAQRMGCTQSRVSKLESGTDDDLRGADLEAYAAALGLDVAVVFAKKGMTIADRVKYHVIAVRRLLHHIADLSADDKVMANEANKFFVEVLYNAVRSVGDAARNLTSAQKSGLLPAIPCEFPPVFSAEDDEDDSGDCAEHEAPRPRNRSSRHARA
jgi:transcriptional regulator with XRE-family HTH domain